MTQKTTENSYLFIHPRWFFKKLSLGFLSLIFFFLVACPLIDPVIEETFIATNVDVTIMVTTTEDSQVFINSNFVFSNQINAVIYYTTNAAAFTNIPFSMTLLSNDERIVFLSNVTGSGNVTTTRIEITNIVTNNSNSYYLLMTNVVSNTEPVVNVTNYFTNVVLSTISITNISWAGFDFFGANLSHLILTNYNLQAATLSSATLSFANLSNANLQEANLINANLTNANLTNANLVDSLLNGEGYLYLRSQGLDGFRPNLENVDLRNADLSNAVLMSVNLMGANLSNANLSNANLSFAALNNVNLNNATLNNADLSGVILIGASLFNASLSNANLSIANLSNAVFTGAHTNGANLDRVKNANWTGAIP